MRRRVGSSSARARWPCCSGVDGSARDNVKEEWRKSASWASGGMRGVASGGAVATPSQVGCRGCGLGVPTREHARGAQMLWAKALASVPTG